MPGCRSRFDHLVGTAGYEFLSANSEEDGNRRKKLKRIIALFQDGGTLTFLEARKLYQAKWGKKLDLDDLNWIFDLKCTTVEDVFRQKSGIFHFDASTGDIGLAHSDPDEDSDDLFDVQQCSRTGNIFDEEEARVEQEVQRRLKCGLELHERLSRGPMNIKEICEATDCRQKEIEGVLNECQPFFVKKGSRVTVNRERSVDEMKDVLRDGLRPPAYADKIHQNRVSSCVVKLRFYDLNAAQLTLELYDAQSQRDKEAMKNKLAELMKKISQGTYSKPAALRRRMPCLARVRHELLRCLIIDGHSTDALTVECVDTGETFIMPLDKLLAIPDYLLAQYAACVTATFAGAYGQRFRQGEVDRSQVESALERMKGTFDARLDAEFVDFSTPQDDERSLTNVLHHVQISFTGDPSCERITFPDAWY